MKVLERARMRAVAGDLPDNVFLFSLRRQDPKAVYYGFLQLVAEALRPAAIVELGAGTGRGTAHLAAGAPGAKVLAVDTEKHGAFDANVEPFPNVAFALGRSDSPEVLALVGDGTVGICFVDSVHAGDYVLREVELWTPKMEDDGVFLFDDLDLDDGMRAVLGSLPFRRKGRLEGLHFSGFGYAVVDR